MYQVILTKCGTVEVYGTYSSKSDAERIAKQHEEAGYYEVAIIKN